MVVLRKIQKFSCSDGLDELMMLKTRKYGGSFLNSGCLDFSFVKEIGRRNKETSGDQRESASSSNT